MSNWIQVERGMISMAEDQSLLGRAPPRLLDVAKQMESTGFLTSAQVSEVNALRKVRNEVLHGRIDYRTVVTPAVVARVKELAVIFREE